MGNPRRLIVLFLCVLVFAASFAPACSAAGKTLTVFAAASMTESMNKIAELYKAKAPDVSLVFNFDSSGTLKTQIQEGAECDIFISAGQKQMDQIDISADPGTNTEKLDFVAPGSRFDIVSNKVVLITPKGSTKGISDFADAAGDKVSIIALGNSDVPVGQYAEQIYKSLSLWDGMNGAGKITFASNVKEVLAQVASGAADCGVVYGTDAAVSGEVEVVASAPDGSHVPVVYPAAILRRAADMSAAEAFAGFLKGDEAAGVFTGMGFSMPKR